MKAKKLRTHDLGPMTMAGRFCFIQRLLDPVILDENGNEIHLEPLITPEQALALLDLGAGRPRAAAKENTMAPKKSAKKTTKRKTKTIKSSAPRVSKRAPKKRVKKAD